MCVCVCVFAFLFLFCLFAVFLNCLVGCFSMIVWTPAVLSVLYTCVLYFLYLPLFSVTEHVLRGKAV